MKTFPARLHVLLAREAPVGVVIRRGPSKQVATLLWQRERDEFSLGQWLRNGRIYERRCDLSPDGQYLLYFAMNAQWSSESQGAWTAISRAPYLRALVMFPKGDCWEGGGLWLGPGKYWLNDRYFFTPALYDNGQFQCVHNRPHTETGGAECKGVYYPRLLRDGWQLKEEGDDGDVFDKALWDGWTMRKIAHAQINALAGKGCYWDEHLLIHPASGTEIACPDWEWAEVDRHRLVWATGGKLFTGSVQAVGLTNVVELYDFNSMKPRRVKDVPYRSPARKSATV